ncbi:hypothetical protein JTE90_027104 [Oedothorax gibbosus]|uniref:Uncharacterized protein n=1 Tax=Oedothorax gibbosus TaxID=931172 RepID=A0AAV6TRV8_9ARAC|nr:hypothetical protein JTE90_027104 [Oedothorax gibbosus]
MSLITHNTSSPRLSTTSKILEIIIFNRSPLLLASLLVKYYAMICFQVVEMPRSMKTKAKEASPVNGGVACPMYLLGRCFNDWKNT